MLNASEPLEGVSCNACYHAQLLMTVAEAKRALSVGHTKFYQLVADGEVELVKIGTASRVVVKSVEAFVERLRATAQARKAV